MNFFESKRRNRSRGESQQFKMLLGDLGCRDDRQDRTLTKTHLQLEAHADGIVIVRTEWIGPAALIGNVPVVTLVELKTQASIRLSECLQQCDHDVIAGDLRVERDIEVGREASSRAEHNFRNIVPPLKARCSSKPRS